MSITEIAEAADVVPTHADTKHINISHVDIH